MLETPRLKVKSKRPNYRRSVATKEVKLFVGWSYLQQLVDQTEDVLLKQEKVYRKWEAKVNTVKGKKLSHFGRPPRKVFCDKESIAIHRGGIALFFETGGRASEILGLREKVYRKGRVENVNLCKLTN